MTEQAHLHGAPFAQMMSSTIQALAAAPGSDEEDVKTQQMAAAMALGALDPQDALETLSAARAVASHFAAMDCYRRAARAEVPDEMAMKLIAKAVSLCRLVTQTTKAMERRREIARALRARARAASQSATLESLQDPISPGRQPAPPHAAANPGTQHPMSRESALRAATASAVGDRDREATGHDHQRRAG